MPTFTNACAYHSPGQFSKPSQFVDRFEIYDQIKNGTFQDVTQRIQHAHRAGILEGFKTVSKAEYQKDKAQLLPTAVFSGVDRSTDQHAHHAGILSADVDENTPDQLRAFFADISAGGSQFIEAAARSVSGAITGAMWVNFKIEIPARFQSIPAAVVRSLSIDKKTPWAQVLEGLHKMYGEALAFLLLESKGIKLGARDLKRGRYLTHDANIFVNPNAVEFGLKALAVALERMEATKEVRNFERVALDIKETHWAKFCEAFAKNNGREMVQGDIHNYLKDFAICANLLGIDKTAVLAYVSETWPSVRITTNCLSYAPVKYKKTFGIWAYKLKKDNKAISVIEGNAGQKCSDLLQGVDTCNKLLIAPTNSGKTFYVAHLEGCKVLVEPTLALVENVCTEYGAFKFAGRKNKAMFEGLKTAKFIATTWASFHNLTLALEDIGRVNEFRGFIDEAHNLSTSASPSFMLKEVRGILALKGKYKSFTLMSGTDVFTAVPELAALEKIEIKLPRPKKDAYLIDAANTLKTAASLFNTSIEKGNYPIILFDNASEDGGLGTLKTLINREDAEYFNSTTKENPNWEKLISKGVLPTGVAGFTTTSVLKEGNNIYDEKDYDFIILGNVHHSTIEQLSNRARKAKSATIHIVKSDKRQKSDKWFDPAKYSFYLEKRAVAACNELNTPGECSEEEQLNELLCRQYIQYLPIKLENGVYGVDYSHLSFLVIQKEMLAEHKNDELLKSNLQKYDIHLSEYIETCDHECTPEEMEEIRCAKQEKKETIERGYSECLDKLAAADCALSYAIQKMDSGKCLSKAEKLAYKSFVKLAEHIDTPAPIIELMRKSGANNAVLKLEFKRLTVKRLLQNDTYMAKNRKLGIVFKSIKQAFKEGQKLTSEQIKEKLSGCLSLDKSFDISQLEQDRNSKALNVLRLFFDLQKQQQRDGEKRQCVFEIKALKFNYLKSKKTKNLSPYFSDYYRNSNKNKVTEMGEILTEMGYPAMWG